jgi:hypothetical protein
MTALQALPFWTRIADVYVKSSVMTSIAPHLTAKSGSNSTNPTANAALCALMNVTAMQTAQTVNYVALMVYAQRIVNNVAIARMASCRVPMGTTAVHVYPNAVLSPHMCAQQTHNANQDDALNRGPWSVTVNAPVHRGRWSVKRLMANAAQNVCLSTSV